MIKYALQCGDGHSFDSWFGSSGDYDRLKAAGHVACIVCGSPNVEKAIMAPRLASAVPADDTSQPVPAQTEDRPLSAPASPAEAALRALKAKIESTSENVGRNFAAEARAIHNGEAPERNIIGEARMDEARDLLADGIPVAPLPFAAGKKN